MEFLETLETIRGEHADIARMFGGEGQRSPSRRGAVDPAYSRRLLEATTFVAEVLEGRRPTHHMQEAMTTSDFPILFGDILDRQVLAAYKEREGTWQGVAKKRIVRDFRGVKLFKPLTGAAGTLDEVGELAEYPEEAVSEQEPQTITVRKFGRRMAYSWEAGVNDDLDLLRELPTRMGRAARRTENYMATREYATSTGPSSVLYSVGNKNIVTGNPALSINGLTTALQVFGNQVNEDGDPIEHEAITLVVPPALEVTANNILNATALEITQQGGIPDVKDTTSSPSATGEVRLLVANWISKRIKVLVNPLLPLIDTTYGNTAWYLFADPNSDREALVMAFLRGWDTPAVFIKSPNARRVGGGGDVDPLDGDFDTDAITYKVRHVIGSAKVDPKATVASQGDGS